jgi:catechol 2,3-dioxygenase-like lactoylglutathione lyase family enzyme
MKLGMVILFAKNMQKMTRFYRDGLGLAEVASESSEGWTVLEAGGVRFALHEIPPSVASRIEIKDPPEVRAGTPVKAVFESPELSALCARLEAFGGQLLPQGSPGRRDALDPEGNVVQLKQA